MFYECFFSFFFFISFFPSLSSFCCYSVWYGLVVLVSVCATYDRTNDDRYSMFSVNRVNCVCIRPTHTRTSHTNTRTHTDTRAHMYTCCVLSCLTMLLQELLYLLYLSLSLSRLLALIILQKFCNWECFKSFCWFVCVCSSFSLLLLLVFRSPLVAFRLIFSFILRFAIHSYEHVHMRHAIIMLFEKDVNAHIFHSVRWLMAWWSRIMVNG